MTPRSIAAATSGLRLKPKPMNLIFPASPFSCSTLSMAIEPSVEEAKMTFVLGYFDNRKAARSSSIPFSVQA